MVRLYVDTVPTVLLISVFSVSSWSFLNVLMYSPSRSTVMRSDILDHDLCDQACGKRTRSANREIEFARGLNDRLANTDNGEDRSPPKNIEHIGDPQKHRLTDRKEGARQQCGDQQKILHEYVL